MMGPRLDRVGVNTSLTISVIRSLPVTSRGVVGSWSGWPEWSMQCLTNFVWVIFCDVSVPPDVHADSVELEVNALKTAATQTTDTSPSLQNVAAQHQIRLRRDPPGTPHELPKARKSSQDTVEESLKIVILGGYNLGWCTVKKLFIIAHAGPNLWVRAKHLGVP